VRADHASMIELQRDNPVAARSGRRDAGNAGLGIGSAACEEAHPGLLRRVLQSVCFLVELPGAG
jgi:hypothetical protein